MKSLVNNAVSAKSNNSAEYSRDGEFAAPKIMVIGVGGAGNNSVNRISAMGVAGAELIAVNTDRAHLGIISDDITKLLIGNQNKRRQVLTRSCKSCKVSKAALEEILDGVDLCLSLLVWVVEQVQVQLQ